MHENIIIVSYLASYDKCIALCKYLLTLWAWYQRLSVLVTYKFQGIQCLVTMLLICVLGNIIALIISLRGIIPTDNLFQTKPSETNVGSVQLLPQAIFETRTYFILNHFWLWNSKVALFLWAAKSLSSRFTITHYVLPTISRSRSRFEVERKNRKHEHRHVILVIAQ